MKKLSVLLAIAFAFVSFTSTAQLKDKPAAKKPTTSTTTPAAKKPVATTPQKSTGNVQQQDSMHMGGAMPSGTTDEEYNYMTKGYAVSLSQGLDMKNGYELGTPYNYLAPGQRIVYTPFFRTQNKQLAGIIVTVGSEYFAIPINNPDLMKKFRDAVALRFYATALSNMLAGYIAYSQEGNSVN